MKFYTVIATLAAAVLGTASSAHAAAALSGEEEAPNLRHIAIDEKDDRELWKRETGQDDTPPGIAKAPWKGEGPNKEEEGRPLVINLTFEQVPDNDDPAANAYIIKELLTNRLVTIEGESFILDDDLDVEADDEDVNTFHLGFGDFSRRSLRDIKGGATTLIAGCNYLVVNAPGVNPPFDTVEECVIYWIRFNVLDQYENTLGVLGFAYGSDFIVPV